MCITHSELLHSTDAAGEAATHLAGYAVLRCQPVDLPELFAELGRLLLSHGWSRFLADNRAMSPLTLAEKDWSVTQ